MKHAFDYGIVNSKATFAIVNKTKFAELVHKYVDPAACRTDHIRQSFLSDNGSFDFGRTSSVRSGKKQKQPGQALLSGIAELEYQISFNSGIPSEQIRNEIVSKVWFFAQYT
jgi:hypothetical protein